MRFLTTSWLSELPSGTTHGLNASLTTLGKLPGETSVEGTLAVDAAGLTWTHAGPSARFAALLVHGSDSNCRDELQTAAGYLQSLGAAALAADKRGAGQSGALSGRKIE